MCGLRIQRADHIELEQHDEGHGPRVPVGQSTQMPEAVEQVRHTQVRPHCRGAAQSAGSRRTNANATGNDGAHRAHDFKVFAMLLPLGQSEQHRRGQGHD